MLHRILVGTAIAAMLAWSALAHAAEPSFPTGSRIGLVPPGGMAVSKAFPGFEDAEQRTAIVLAELPADAFLQLEKGIFGDALSAQGITMEKRQLMPFASGMGYLVTARQDIAGVPHRKWFVVASEPDFTVFVTVQRPDTANDTYSDDAIRGALATMATRTVPREEQLELLPFKVNDLAGFPNMKMLVRGAALLLSDGTEGITEKAERPYMIVSVAPGAPPTAAERGNFAQRVLAGIQGYSDVRIVSSEPMRISGMPGYELRAEGKHAATGVDVMMVQWLRFGPGGFMRMIGIAQKMDWPDAFTRFRSVRDGIEPR
jgi:hypothetical protein